MATYTFNSVAEFGRAMQSITPKHRDPDWSGETFEKSLEYAIKGDTRMVAEAEKLLDKVQANIETTGRQWQNAVVGNIPSVPDYVMGHPESMRRLTTYESEAAPIRIWVGTNSSASWVERTTRPRVWQTPQSHRLCFCASVPGMDSIHSALLSWEARSLVGPRVMSAVAGPLAVTSAVLGPIRS